MPLALNLLVFLTTISITITFTSVLGQSTTFNSNVCCGPFAQLGNQANDTKGECVCFDA